MSAVAEKYKDIINMKLHNSRYTLWNLFRKSLNDQLGAELMTRLGSQNRGLSGHIGNRLQDQFGALLQQHLLDGSKGL